MNVEIYLVGTDEDDAQEGAPYFDLDDATQYAHESGGLTVYTVTARLDFNSVEQAPDTFQPRNWHG